MSKWDGSKGYEFALQWQNVGDGAPQWRYWDPHQLDRWVSLGVTESEALELKGEQWHPFTLEGGIINGQVRYERFAIDQQSYDLDATHYGKPLRQWLNRRRIEDIVDFGDLRVFQRATTYPCIIRVREGPPSDHFRVTQVDTLDFSDLDGYVRERSYKVRQTTLHDNGWSLLSPRTETLLAKLRGAGVPLVQFATGNLHYGIKTGLNKAFVIDSETRWALVDEDPNSAELIKPFLVGRDVNRYVIDYQDRYVIFTRRGVAIHQYPAIRGHLEQFKQALIPKPKGHRGPWKGRNPGPYEWYEIQDTVAYWQQFEKPKILWPGISREITAFALDADGYYGNDNTQMIVGGDAYLLGILNSRLMRFVLVSICDKVQGGFYRLKMIYIEQLPIRTIDFDDPDDVARHDRMVALVERMLALHEKLASAKTPTAVTVLQRQIEATDGQIDRLVYELYGLTEEEIGIVENA